MNFKKIHLYFWTIKFLRIEQVIYRIKYYLFGSNRVNVNINVKGIKALSWKWNSPIFSRRSYYDHKTFNILNKKIIFDAAIGWNDKNIDLLWLYNLHYFDDLNSKDATLRKDSHLSLIKNWIENNPLQKGGVGWDAYPLSLRLINWIKWYSRNQINDHEILQSILSQAEVLKKNLEYHILGNHLFTNAKALMFAGHFFDGDIGNKFLTKALSIFDRELDEQFLEDGGHFELSPMYTALTILDILDILNLDKISSRDIDMDSHNLLRKIAERGIQWLQIMSHPDGDISFFNDSSKNIAPKISELINYSKALDIYPLKNDDRKTLMTLKNSGYSCISIHENYILFDHANLGPDYLLGHGHADNLSLEWSIGHQRVLVNSGTSLYGNSAERHRQRQTSSHNTVVVDQCDSSEIWHGFRVARRAYSNLISSNFNEDFASISASHDGYQRLSGKVTHIRTIKATGSELKVIDELNGKWNQAHGYFHFHPDIKVEEINKNSINLSLPNGLQILMESSGKVVKEKSTWHPSFNSVIDNTRCKINFDNNKLITRFSYKRINS